jgi:hypothetical protein
MDVGVVAAYVAVGRLLPQYRLVVRPSDRKANGDSRVLRGCSVHERTHDTCLFPLSLDFANPVANIVMCDSQCGRLGVYIADHVTHVAPLALPTPGIDVGKIQSNTKIAH